MKKIFIFLLAVCANMSVSAVGRNDGTTKANAIDLDMGYAISQDGGAKYYRIDFAPLYEYDTEDLAGNLTLIFTNPADPGTNSVSFTLQTAIFEEKLEIQEMLEGGQSYNQALMSGNVIVRMKLNEIYFLLTTSDRIQVDCILATPITPGADCTNPITLSANDTGNGHTQESGITWYEIDFAGVPKDAIIHLYFQNEEDVTNRIGYGFDECESTMHEYFDVAPNEKAGWFPISPKELSVTSFIMPISSTGKCRVYLEVEGASTDPEPTQVTISYTNSVDNGSVDQEEVELHVPEAPEFEGFTFVKWAVVAGDLADGIEIQAVYTANDPQSAPAIYTNPSNPSQKLIRNGNVYILRDNKTYTLTGQEVK